MGTSWRRTTSLGSPGPAAARFGHGHNKDVLSWVSEPCRLDLPPPRPGGKRAAGGRGCGRGAGPAPLGARLRPAFDPATGHSEVAAGDVDARPQVRRSAVVHAG